MEGCDTAIDHFPAELHNAETEILIRRDGVRRDGRLDGARVLLALWREGRGQRAQEHTRQYFAKAGKDCCVVQKRMRDSRNQYPF